MRIDIRTLGGNKKSHGWGRRSWQACIGRLLSPSAPTISGSHEYRIYNLEVDPSQSPGILAAKSGACRGSFERPEKRQAVLGGRQHGLSIEARRQAAGIARAGLTAGRISAFGLPKAEAGLRSAGHIRGGCPALAGTDYWQKDARQDCRWLMFLQFEPEPIRCQETVAPSMITS